MVRARGLDLDRRLPSEHELARLFGVARSVVRESLGQLKALGLVEPKAGKGVFISEKGISPALTLGGFDPAELQEVRILLELRTARLAAKRIRDGDILALRKPLDDFENSLTAAQRHESDASFHQAIAQATGNRLFVRWVGDLRWQIRAQAMIISTPARVSEARVEHRKIYDAIEAHDQDGAAEAMRQHLEAVGVALSIGGTCSEPGTEASTGQGMA